jgi:hypothetical protein
MQPNESDNSFRFTQIAVYNKFFLTGKKTAQ